VRFFQHTEAQALDFSDDHMTVFCGNGAAVRAGTLFMANAYARHINGDIRERTIFTYDYVVEVELPDGADVLAATGGYFGDAPPYQGHLIAIDRGSGRIAAAALPLPSALASSPNLRRSSQGK